MFKKKNFFPQEQIADSVRILVLGLIFLYRITAI